MNRSFFVFLCCIAVVTGCAKAEDIGFLQRQIFSHDESISDLQIRLDIARTDIEDLNDQIELIEIDFDGVVEELEKVDAKADSLGEVLAVTEESLDSLRNVTAAIESSIDDVNDALEKLKDDVKLSDEALQKQIDSAKMKVAAIEVDINGIKTDVAAVNTRVDKVIEDVKNAFASMISSVVYVNRNPEHKSTVWYKQRGEDVLVGEKDTLDFLISPVSAWEFFEKSLVDFKMVGSYDIRPEQKDSVFFDIPVIELIPNESDGVMSFVVDCSVFDEDFFTGNKSASIALYVENLISGITSDFVQAVPAQKPSIVLFDEELNINVGTAKQIKFVTYPADSPVWYLYEGDAITVGPDGIVTALTAGETDVRVSVIDGGDSATVHVTTQEVPVVDLSENGTANCYLVPEAGVYTFNASVKGNGAEGITGAAYADVLWESIGTATAPEVGCVIDSVNYENGVVTLITNPLYHEGNAVIAVKDESDKVLWSWHIWATSYNPEIEYDEYVGKEGVAVMNRELGVVTHDWTAGKSANSPLYYQWGRKDPFTNPSVKATHSAGWTITGSSAGTVEYAAAHPNTFILGILLTSYDWIFGGRVNSLWGAEKTMYDPCPVGWKVADKGIWDNFPKGYTDVYHPEIPGWYFDSQYSTPATWYYNSGVFNSQMSFSDDAQGIWSADAGDRYSYYLGLGTDGQVNIWNDKGRAYGMPVRCVAE